LIYCLKCSHTIVSASIVDVELCNLSSFNAYVSSKYIKHTTTQGSCSVKSIFTNEDMDPNSPLAYKHIKNLCVSTAGFGCLDIDDSGRRSLVYFAHRKTGVTIINVTPSLIPCDAVRLVHYADNKKIHAFPISSESLKNQMCSKCGCSIYNS
jgi:hypothetical protein